jgi:hypothetical protein
MVNLKDTPYGKRGVRFDDLTNQKFGRLTLLKFTGMNKNNKAEWLCRCECGNEITIEGKRVKNGNTRSCGCLWMESISLPPGEADINAHFLEYRLAAKKRDLSFSINREQFIKLTENACCYYCNRQSKGIDRVKNKIGYTPSNCVPCCKDCNLAKGTKTTSEFLDMVESIYKNMWRNCNGN